MVRVCASEGCKISARFNHLGEQKGKYCSRHKEPGMIDIVHPHCKIEGCTTLASFNMPGESRGEFCSQHKQEGMVNVKHRRCAENGCNTRPAFNWKGEEKGSFCNKHKEKGMVNVDKKEARADGAEGGGAVPPRKRSKAAQQPMPHDMAQHSQQQDGFDPARLAQQLPELAALATGEANGFMGMQHALHYGHLPPEFAAANALGVNVPVPLDPSQRLPQEQLAHHLDARNAHAGVAGVPDMGQAVWSAAAAQEHHRQALDQQQQQQQHGRVSEGQQMSQHPATAPQQGHSHMGLEQQTAHLQQHLVQQLQGGDTVQNPEMHQQHMAQSLEQQQEQLQQDGREYIDQHQPEPSLPSAEELRQRVKLGETGSAEAAAAPAGSLGHLMLVQVIKFVRESLETQIVTDEGRQQLMMFTDHFSQWPEDKRVEEYAMLHFSWSVGREDKQHAVLQRVEKVLAV